MINEEKEYVVRSAHFYQRAASAFATIALVASLVGCQHEPTVPLAPPPASLQTDHFLGSILSGPVGGAPPVIDPSQTFAVRATFIALEQPPRQDFDPLGARARLISEASAGRPMLSTAKLGQRVQILKVAGVDDAVAKLVAAGCGQTARMQTLVGALPAGVTADFRAFESLAGADGGEPMLRQIELEIGRPDLSSHLQVGLSLRDFLMLGKQGSTQSEEAVFDWPADLGTTRPGASVGTCFVVPMRFGGGESGDQSRAIAIVLEATADANDADHLAAVTRCRADLQRWADDIAKRPAISTANADASALAAAIAALELPGDHRVAMVFLADRTGAAYCGDLALISDDALLEQLRQSVHTNLTNGSASLTRESVSWALDRAALQLLATRLANQSSSDSKTADKPKLTDEQAALLATFAGEAGRQPASMDAVLKGVADRRDFENRLLAENLIDLEDHSPASRVRAFDWLAARGHAPVGYDPLASGKDRRRALDQGLAAAASTATTPPSGGTP